MTDIAYMESVVKPVYLFYAIEINNANTFQGLELLVIFSQGLEPLVILYQVS